MQSTQLAALVSGVHRLWQQPVGDPRLSHKCSRMTKHWLRTDSSILKGTYYVFPSQVYTYNSAPNCTDSIRCTGAHGAAGRRSNPEKPPQDLTLKWLSLSLGGVCVCVRVWEVTLSQLVSSCHGNRNANNSWAVSAVVNKLQTLSLD